MGEKLKGINVQIREHKRFLRLRNQNRLIQSMAFLDAWDLFNDVDKDIILDLIEKIDPLMIKRWIRNILYDDFENHTTIELRQLASKNHIKNYSRMTKEELIYTLIQKGIEDDSKRHAGDDSKSLGQDEATVIIGGLPETSD